MPPPSFVQNRPSSSHIPDARSPATCSSHASPLSPLSTSPASDSKGSHPAGDPTSLTRFEHASTQPEQPAPPRLQFYTPLIQPADVNPTLNPCSAQTHTPQLSNRKCSPSFIVHSLQPTSRSPPSPHVGSLSLSPRNIEAPTSTPLQTAANQALLTSTFTYPRAIKLITLHNLTPPTSLLCQQFQLAGHTKALRYLMRFQSEYTCKLLNVARHSSFGLQAAEMVLRTIPSGWPKVSVESSRTDIEEFVWSNHKPWIPRPILSMHVRMGDKACEMKVVEFENYMNLAERIRKNFPNLNSIWLSTEMQEVIDKSKSYPHWKFYYTNVTRQIGNMSMASYEASLGRETSTNYPLVNFIMATEADFFIGALGSTWCFLIDGMRNTGGKVMAGYLSVNKDRFW